MSDSPGWAESVAPIQRMPTGSSHRSRSNLIWLKGWS
ncbi:hypothetical protein HNR03_001165 [Pseudomonas sp. JAI111]|nr:hypothetical protein [Pseudomonas sp. JAI111]